MRDATEQFRDAIRAAGLMPPDQIVADGKLHRFASNGSRGDDAGYYVLHDDDAPAGIFGCWRSGVYETWRPDIVHTLTADERESHRQRVAQMRVQREAADARRRAAAARTAGEIWKAATPAGADHPYLVRKGIRPVETLREIDVDDLAHIIGYRPQARDEPLVGRVMVAPVKVDGRLSTIEMIDQCGRKSALAGGAKAGGFWTAQPLPDVDDTDACVLVGEGVATVLSAREASGLPVVAALSAGQLEAAARSIRARLKTAIIVVLGDLDKDSGKVDPRAERAARAVGGVLAVPDFGGDRQPGETDFNDLQSRKGLEAVGAVIEAAIEAAQGLVSISGADAWPDPRPIVAELPPAPAFDAKLLLPGALADYVLDEADRMPCPPDYIAPSLIVALGAVIGSRCALKPKRRDDWLVTPNLFGGVVGEPGSMKSSAIDKGLKFLDRLEADEADRQAQRMIEFEAEIAAHKAREAAIEKKMRDAAGGKGKRENAEAMAIAVADKKSLKAPEEPVARRFRANDATIEKLGDMLAKSPDGVLVFRDELVGLLSSWEREGHEADRAFYLEGWNGLGSFAIDRIGRGSLLVRSLNLSVFGGIQPDKLGRYLAGIVDSADNDGRIQRFQALVYPEAVQWRWQDRYPIKGARESVRDTFLRLAAFDPVQDGAQPADDFHKVPYFAFDDEALGIFVEWMTELHQQVIPGESDRLLQQHWSKYPKLFCSVALILHLAEGRIGPVQKDSAMRAAAWCEYLAGHARRVYALLDGARVAAAQALAAKIAAGKLDDGFTAADVVRKDWSRLRGRRDVEVALSLLEETGHVVAVEPDDGAPGRPTVRYTINPKSRRSAR